VMKILKNVHEKIGRANYNIGMRGPKPKPPCSCAECGKIKILIRGLCNTCYTRQRRQGKLAIIPKPIVPQELTDLQKEVLTGLLLGDGCLYRRKPTHLPYLAVVRKLTDREYLNWCAGIFDEFVISRREETIFDKRTNKAYERATFTTRRCSVFDSWHNNWYLDHKKILPPDIVITPLVLAIWFADDGHVRASCSPWRLRMKLSTNAFSESEVERLVDLLNKRYLKKFTMEKSEGRPVICSSDAGTRAFCKEIDD